MRQRRKPKPLPLSGPSCGTGAFGRKESERGFDDAEMFRRRLAGDRRGSNAWLETREGTGVGIARSSNRILIRPGKRRLPSPAIGLEPGRWGLVETPPHFLLCRRQFCLLPHPNPTSLPVPGATAITDAAFYRARAEEAKVEASRTTLTCVREKCLRAADAWTVMAERVEQTQRMREMKRHDADAET